MRTPSPHNYQFQQPVYDLMEKKVSAMLENQLPIILDNYFKNNSGYDEEFALTNFYIGAAFINQGNLSKGAYYFYRAKESTTDENTIKTIQQYIDQIATYL